MHACLRKLTNLRELHVRLDLTAATLAALAPLTALTKLQLVRFILVAWLACSAIDQCFSMQVRDALCQHGSGEDLRW